MSLPRLQCNHSTLAGSSVSLRQTSSEGFTFTLQSPSSSPRSICPPSPFPQPARGWINVWLWETCRWQMFTFIMHDFHVAVNFSEPAKSRKWFCTLCLFNEIVTLMEVRLNTMEMFVVFVTSFLLFFPQTSFHVDSLSVVGPTQSSRSWERQLEEFCSWKWLIC